MRRNFQEMIPAEALTVVEVRGDPELAFCHRPNPVCYSRAFL
jgi:hypothetical protein